MAIAISTPNSIVISTITRFLNLKKSHKKQNFQNKHLKMPFWKFEITIDIAFKIYYFIILTFISSTFLSDK